MEASWTPQLLCKLCSRKGIKSILVSSCKRLLWAETQMERQKILGEVMGPGSDSWHPGVPKSLQFRVPLQIHELNPSLPGDLGSMGLLHGFGCLSLTGESASSRRPAVTFCGLQGPSSNPGLGILMNSRGKSTRLMFSGQFSITGISAARWGRISTARRQYQAQSYRNEHFLIQNLILLLNIDTENNNLLLKSQH